MRDASCCSFEVMNGGVGVSFSFFGRYRVDYKFSFAASSTIARGFFAGLDVSLGRLYVFVKLADLDRLVFYLVKFRVEFRRQGGGEIRDDRPVFGLNECFDLAFAFDDEANSDCLHAAGGEFAADRFPKDRRNLVTDQPVENSASLLGVDEILVYLLRFLERILDRVLRDLIEHHAIDTGMSAFFRNDLFGQMLADRLALAVRVGCEINCVARFRGLFQIGNDLFIIAFFGVGNDFVGAARNYYRRPRRGPCVGRSLIWPIDAITM